MFPNITMKGKICSNSIIENKHYNNKVGALFSGGVDAFGTLLDHMDEKPNLLTIWGADIKLDDLSGWQKVDEHHKMVAKKFDLEYDYVKSNFKECLNYKYLSKYVSRYTNDEWWHGFQHGIGILGHMAPIAYIKHFGKIYIASSFTAEYKGLYTCASDPTIDNYLRFSSCKVIHDGYEFNRQDKIHRICNYADNNKLINIPIRVCWESEGGENCCLCEKCTRTIMGFLAEKKDPNNFGFDFTENKRKRMIKKLKEYSQYTYRYVCIQKRLIENYDIDEMPKDLLKFRSMKIKLTMPKYIKIIKKIKSLPKRGFCKIKNVIISNRINK